MSCRPRVVAVMSVVCNTTLCIGLRVGWVNDTLFSYGFKSFIIFILVFFYKVKEKRKYTKLINLVLDSEYVFQMEKVEDRRISIPRSTFLFLFKVSLLSFLLPGFTRCLTFCIGTSLTWHYERTPHTIIPRVFFESFFRVLPFISVASQWKRRGVLSSLYYDHQSF